MMFPRDSDEQRRVMYEAQLKTNELLEQLIDLLSPKKAVQKIEKNEPKTEQVELKRPEMLKMISQLANKPQGFNTWNNEKLRDFLKGK